VPALAGIATACLAPQAQAEPVPAHTAAQPAAVTDVATYAGVSSAPLLAVTAQATGRHKAGSARPVSYTVRPGDSLSAIAGRFYHKQDAWPVLYWANHGQIRWANIITAGQVLRVPAEPAKIPGAPALLGPPAPAPAPAEALAPAEAAPAAAPAAVSPVYAPATSTASYSGGVPGGAFGQCVVARESGGNAQVMNSTGHYGLYQFSASTWAAYGGSPADFGHASVAQQNQVFANALAQGGQSNWSPYDGC
jgi:LysM repeat protein